MKVAAALTYQILRGFAAKFRRWPTVVTDEGNSAIDQNVFVAGNPVRRLIGGGLMLIAVIAIATSIMVSNFRERALHDTERELENIVLLLAIHFDQQFEEFEVVQNDLVAHIRSMGISSSAAFKTQMSGAGISEMLKSKSNGSSDAAGINIFDSEGILINSSELPLPHVRIDDRAYFKAFKSGSTSKPRLIELVKSRLSENRWTTIISRKITGADGEFLGLITRGIAVATFEHFFAPVALGGDADIAILLRDGTLLAHYPHVETLIGQNFSQGPFFQVISDAEHGTTRKKSVLDGKDRLASVRQLANFPIVIVATKSVSAALGDWRDQTQLLIGLAFVLAFVIVIMLFLVVRQLTHQHRLSQRRLALEKRRLDIAVNNMKQGLLLFDSSQRLVIFNQRYIDMLGGSPNVVKPGCTIRDLPVHRRDTGSFDGDVDEYCSKLLRKMEKGKVFQSIFDTADRRSIDVLYQPLADGGWVTTLEDITERRRSDQLIAHMAHYDELTGLPNRALFRETLARELQRVRPGEQVAVLYFDIDEFKNVNDSLGHPVGDELLKAVASRLPGCLQRADFAARLGGDEFAIIQSAVNSSGDVTDLVARIYEAIRKPYVIFGHQLLTDASIGIAMAPQDGADMDELLKNADLAMYSAKANGRRSYRFYEPEMEARVKARRLMEIDLRQAIIDGGFEVHYQPLLNLHTGEISGCEALLRWHHPERGMVSPAEFIPLAEETGLITQLGEWVLMAACTEAATWPAGIKVAVNVSPVQFRSDTLALRVVAALAASGLSANRLELEITEAVLIGDDDAALAILYQLRTLGVRIALDDFGTGYSSLSYLERFPFDKIKIDRCFITNIAEPSGSSSIVQAVVAIAAARNMTTTAEGVETERQKELLAALGCTEMQGYLFSPAKPALELKRLFFSNGAPSVAVA